LPKIESIAKRQAMRFFNNSTVWEVRMLCNLYFILVESMPGKFGKAVFHLGTVFG